MRVESREADDPDRERVAVVPDSTEDLWHLQYVIEPGDIVAGDTTRRIQRDDDRMRDTGGQRESMWVALVVEELEYHRFADRLRVSGEIVACSREDQLGNHHTLNVEVHDEVELEKQFKPDQRERLEAAQAATDDPDVLVVTVEEGRAELFDVSPRGPEYRATVTAGSGKREGESTRGELFAEVASIVGRSDADAIVLAGPGFTKDDAADHLRSEIDALDERLHVVDTSAIGERGVHEVLQRGVLENVRTEARLAQERAVIEDVLERLKTGDGRVTYGPEQVATAAEYGAVETLCVLDDHLKRERTDDGEWSIELDTVIERVEQQGGEVSVLSAKGEPGRQLDSLGGIAALLRYSLD